MAHFAILDDNYIVTNVVVIADSDCSDENGNESEAIGAQFCHELWGPGIYKQTSYNDNIRKQYAIVGGTYDTDKKIFINPQPFPSWALDANNDWQPPFQPPNDGWYPRSTLPDNGKKVYHWSESEYDADNTTGWQLADPQPEIV